MKSKQFDFMILIECLNFHQLPEFCQIWPKCISYKMSNFDIPVFSVELGKLSKCATCQNIERICQQLIYTNKSPKQKKSRFHNAIDLLANK